MDIGREQEQRNLAAVMCSLFHAVAETRVRFDFEARQLARK